MIVRLIYNNRLPIDVVVHSNMASDQPLVAGQSLQWTMEVQPGDDGVADIELSCTQGRAE